MNTAADTKPRLTTPLFASRTRDGKPEQVWADGGANRQDGRRPVHTCNACSTEVVWVKSVKTGRWYRASVHRYEDNVNGGHGAGRWYLKAKPHDCAAVLARHAELDARHAARELQAERHNQEQAAYHVGQALPETSKSIAQAVRGLMGLDRWLLSYDETAEALAYGVCGGLPDMEARPFGPGL